MINKLIEQIGGRERLEQLSSDFGEPSTDVEAQIMARAILAVLDAKPVGTVSIAPDWNSIPRRNIATVNMRPDLVMSEMRDGDKLYTTPPAASVQDGWQLVPIEPTEEMNRAGWDAMNAHDAINPTYSAMLAAAPAPENKE